MPVTVGSEGERGIDISKLRSESKHITLDEGYGNTGSCKSDITFINGEKGILRYRGIPIEQLAEKSRFVEVAYLLIFGDLPTRDQLDYFSDMLTDNELLHEDMRYHFDGFPSSSHPMAILSAMINASSCYHPTLLEGYDEERFVLQAARLLAKTRTIAAFSYRKLKGLPIVYPQTKYQYTANFMHMMFSRPDEPYELNEKQVRALDLIFLLHADHEQNCSTSTVRMVASSQANLFASAAAGVCALWGPLHGGANQGVIEQLQQIYDSDYSISDIIAQVKDRKRRLMGFGHRVYKNYDPRARIIKTGADSVLEDLNYSDPLLDIARELEDVALNDDFFTERKLYPNVDFYSGIIMRALGIPLEFFTVMFAIGRMPGWIANFREVAKSNSPIYRPRQIYTGPTERDYVPMAERG
jgi:citrate synthase